MPAGRLQWGKLNTTGALKASVLGADKPLLDTNFFIFFYGVTFFAKNIATF